MPQPRKNTQADFAAPAQNRSNGPFFIIGFAVFILLFLAIIFAISPFLSGSGQVESYVPNGLAIIPVKGEISNEGGGAFSATLTANDLVSFIEDADNDGSVGAIFLDIDSPGGEVVASKQVAYKIRSASKPVYSYINSVGASGAYYIASASDYIMADQDSITGSIGVIWLSYNLEGLLEKIGVEATVLKVGKYKDIGSPYRDATEDENAILQEIIDQAYSNFRLDVLEFRSGKINASRLDAVADGRILTGSQALSAGLIDETMTREEALRKAAELANMSGEPNLIEYGPRELGLFDVLLASGKAFGSGFIGSVGSAALDTPKLR